MTAPAARSLQPEWRTSVCHGVSRTLSFLPENQGLVSKATLTALTTLFQVHRSYTELAKSQS